MKRAFLVLSYLLIASTLVAQKLNVVELIRYYKMDISFMSEDLLKKNFKLVKKSNDDLENKSTRFTYFWAVNFNYDEGDAMEWFTVSFFDEIKSRIIYETRVRTNYIAFRESLIEQGFKFMYDIPNDGEKEGSSFYENDVYTVFIQPRSDRWTIYFRRK